jgi:mono/diheme cytochrome c family protein
VYVVVTLESMRADRTRYDRRMSSPDRPPRRIARVVVLPLVLFTALSGTAFGLAKLHLAKPGAPKAAPGSVRLGDPYRGELVFQQNCAACHGAGATGGIGPKLVGAAISLAAVKAQIDQGGGAMPPRLVSGQAEEDVLAYVGTLVAPGTR